MHTFSSDVQRHALEEGQFLRLHRGSLLVMTLLVMQSYNKQRNSQVMLQPRVKFWSKCLIGHQLLVCQDPENLFASPLVHQLAS